MVQLLLPVIPEWKGLQRQRLFLLFDWLLLLGPCSLNGFYDEDPILNVKGAGSK